MTMLRSILVALGAAACLLAFAALGELPGGPIARALAGVITGVLVTTLIYGQATFVAVSLGAMSPLVFAAAERTSLALATAAMCLLWLMPRFVLAPSRRRLTILVTVSAGAAAVAGWIFAAYLEAPWAAHIASCIFAGSCLALVGVVVPVPSATALALRTAAAAVDAPIRAVVLRAADEYESSRWQPRPRAARRQWRALVRLTDQRASLERARGGSAEEQRQDLDQRIETLTSELAAEPHAAAPLANGATPTAAPSDAAGTPTTANDATASRASRSPSATALAVIDETESASAQAEALELETALETALEEAVIALDEDREGRGNA